MRNKIEIHNDPQHGLVITCHDMDQADALDDYLVANDVHDVLFRFSEHKCEFFVRSIDIDQLTALVSSFVAFYGPLDHLRGSQE